MLGAQGSQADGGRKYVMVTVGPVGFQCGQFQIVEQNKQRAGMCLMWWDSNVSSEIENSQPMRALDLQVKLGVGVS